MVNVPYESPTHMQRAWHTSDAPYGLTLSGFVVYVRETHEMFAGTWRRGQAWFNCLGRVKPHLGARVCGTLLDPYNDDDKIDDLYNWLHNHWEDEV